MKSGFSLAFTRAAIEAIRVADIRVQVGVSDLKPILQAKSHRQRAGEASLEIEQSNPFRCNGDTHHLLNH